MLFAVELQGDSLVIKADLALTSGAWSLERLGEVVRVLECLRVPEASSGGPLPAGAGETRGRVRAGGGPSYVFDDGTEARFDIGSHLASRFTDGLYVAVTGI